MTTSPDLRPRVLLIPAPVLGFFTEHRGHLLRLMLALLTVLAVASPASAPSVRAAVEDGSKISDGLAIYLGVLPAALVRGHAAKHGEEAMHGGIPKGRNDYHLVVAVFEAGSGARIGDAEVEATVSELGHIAEKHLSLEPMQVADTVTYGGFTSLPDPGRYTIGIEVRRPGRDRPTRVEFAYQRDE